MALFEYRVYEVVPVDAGHDKRFETMTRGHFQRHGIGVVGFGSAVGHQQRLHYILRFDDMAHPRERLECLPV